MAKMTLLDIVQDILNDIDGDEVNSISDTEESTQVAQIVKTTYYEMLGRRNWPHLSKLTVLTSLADSSHPTYLNTPENMSRMEWFKYNKIKSGETKNRYDTIVWKDPDEFIALTNDRDVSKTNVEEITDFDGAKFQIFNDKAPKYFTSFDDRYIVMDAYDSDVEATVQGSKTQVRLYLLPDWTVDDTFIPDLPSETFPALLAEAKSVSAFKLNEVVDQKAEQQSERQQKRLSVDGWSVNGGIRYPNYGRKKPISTNRTLFNKEP